jgi:hypothetical protein
MPSWERLSIYKKNHTNVPLSFVAGFLFGWPAGLLFFINGFEAVVMPSGESGAVASTSNSNLVCKTFSSRFSTPGIGSKMDQYLSFVAGFLFGWPAGLLFFINGFEAVVMPSGELSGIRDISPATRRDDNKQSAQW